MRRRGYNAAEWFGALLLLLVLLGACFVTGLVVQLAAEQFSGLAEEVPSTPPATLPPPTPTRAPSATTTRTPSAAPGATLSPTFSLPSPTGTLIPTPTLTVSVTVATVEYRVQPGDTLAEIAERFGSTISEIRALNPDLDPDRIEIDDVLLLPQP